ncbi:PAS domain S-box-containing protein [Paenibacillus cellulosilyticus]|uniref:histidine kinase n=1 Tax=Paenibacillus cellulosilyticus TaxID=375489 RepID=A0A2V2YVJ6_9BACL|nr:response regulator [Paenibacillus cellulosilyticus]PWW05168.1 PAS domain S-box-containing protein [Paenibacillus cellulosilyticus]
MKSFIEKLNSTMSTINILIVDDRPENLIALEAILDSPKYRLFRAYSGEEALRYVLTTDFAVILLDVQMPGMSGFETAELIKMRERSRYVPIIFITAISQAAEHVKHGYSVGAVDYIFKPFHPETLKMKIEAFVQMYMYQEQIKLQSEVMRVIGEASNDTIVTVNEQGLILTANSNAVSMFGFPQDKLIGSSIDQLVPSLSSKLEHTANSRSGVIETSALRYGSIPFPVDIQTGRAIIMGQPIYVCSVRDVTEREQQRDERFRQMFDATPCIIFLRSLQDRRYVNVNEGFLTVIGRPLEEVINQTSDLLHYYVDTDDIGGHSSTFDRWSLFRNVRIRYMTHSGELRDGIMSSTMTQIQGESCLLTVVTDISERIHLEREMVRLDRLNLTGEMAAGIVHELRNPMTTIRGFLQLSKNRPSNEYNDIMIEELDRVHDIVTEFLSVGSSTPASHQQKQINTVIETLFPLIQSKAITGNHEIALELGECPAFDMNEKELRQLILNLVLNGLDAMRSAGTIIIQTYSDEKEVVLAVKDQGTGIPAEFLDKLGTPFFSTKSNGTGLGLSVCYGIAARHNAIIKVHTSEQGTTFFVHFNLEQQ